MDTNPADDADATKFYRSTKEAYGYYLPRIKPSHDWAWTIGIIIVFAAFAAGWVWHRTGA